MVSMLYLPSMSTCTFHSSLRASATGRGRDKPEEMLGLMDLGRGGGSGRSSGEGKGVGVSRLRSLARKEK